MKDVKIRYYYMFGGDKEQEFVCDWSSLGTSNVKGSMEEMAAPMVGADRYLELTFSENTGTLGRGQSAEIKTRFNRSGWKSYLQTDDYSFNGTDTAYVDWTRATVYIEDQLVWGEEPDEPMPFITAAKLQMYNTNRSENTTSIQADFRLYNTGTVQFNLEDVKIRYYYTIDGEKPQNFVCYWSDIGAVNVTGTFQKIPFTVTDIDYYLEIGFKGDAKNLIAGDFIEFKTGFNKNGWENMRQSNDYSFNGTASNYTDWSKVAVYIKDRLVWGGGLIFGCPSSISAQAAEDTVTVNWSEVEGATGFDIEADGAVVHNGLSTEYEHTNLDPGTKHTYRIRATSPIMNGDWSDPLIIWTIPGIPQNIQMTSTGNSITLTWDPVQGADGFDVEVQGAVVDNGAGTSYTHTGLNPNLQQTYRVRAKNASGAGQWSEIVMQSTLTAVPTNLNAEVTDTVIKVTWDTVAGATGYDVAIDGTKIESVTTPVYIHGGLEPNTGHTYRVRSKNALGASDWSEEISVTTLLPAPENLNAKVTAGEIIVTWDPVEGAESYEIEVDGKIHDNGNQTTYVHTGYAPNTEHTYRVRARNREVVSEWSKLITRKTLTGVPMNLTAVAASTQITVTWDPVVGAAGYEIEVDGTIVDNGLSTTYVHTGLKPNTEHTYRVRAVNEGGASEWSEAVTAKTILGIPENFAASPSETSITLTWDAVEGAAGYDKANSLLSSETFERKEPRQQEVQPQSISMGDRVEYTYDKAGRLTRVVGPSGRETLHTYDEKGNLTRKEQKVADGYYDAVEYTYDVQSKVQTEAILVETADIDLSRAVSTIPGQGNYATRIKAVTTYAYYDNGQLKTKKDANGNETLYEYDYDGRLVKKADPMKNVALYSYDENGNLKEEKNARGVSAYYEYDSLNRLIRKKAPAAEGGLAITRYVYDKIGNLVKEVTPNHYDTAKDTEALAETMTGVKDPRGFVTIFSYNAFGRIKVGKDPYDSTIEYKYDLNGNVATVKDKRGSVSYFFYDANNRVTEKKIPLDKDSSGNILYAREKYLYDEAGNITKKTLTGTRDKTSVRETYYTYYDNNLVNTVTDTGDSFAKNYYDKNGNAIKTERLREKDAARNAVYDVEKFEYDNMNRQIKDIKLVDKSDIDHSDGLPGELADDEYPDKIRIITGYEYDRLGNKVREIGPKGYENAADRDEYTVTFTYDGLNRLEKVIREANGTEVYSRYFYDEVGNTVRVRDERGFEKQYTYDSMNRLKTSTDALGSTFTYTYDIAGNKISETNAKGHTMTYSYDRLNRVETVTDPYNVVISKSSMTQTVTWKRKPTQKETQHRTPMIWPGDWLRPLTGRAMKPGTDTTTMVSR